MGAVSQRHNIGLRLITHATNVEEQTLEVVEVVVPDGHETGGLVLRRTRRFHICVKSIGRHEDQGRAGINDASSRIEDRRVRGSIRDRLVDAPELAGRRGCCERTEDEDQHNPMSTLTLGRHLREGNTSGGLGVIDTTESELSVGVVGRGRGSEEDGDEVLADNALREEVVCDYRSTTRKYHSYAVQSSIPYQ